MKQFFGKMSLMVLILLVCSCVSMTHRELSNTERSEANIIGRVTTEFTAFKVFHFGGNNGIKNKANQELLKKAKEEFGENVVVRNILLEGKATTGTFFGNLFFMAPAITGIVFTAVGPGANEPVLTGIGIPLLAVGGSIGHFQKITATGDVVVFGASGSTYVNQNRLEGAIKKAAEIIINDMPQNANIAILNMMSSDVSAAEYAIDELEFSLVESKKFKIVDRRLISRILNEQNFQLSGDVDDDSAVSIGKLIGANIVVTGSISGSGSTQRLFLRILDVQTGQITKMVREQF